MKLTWLGHSCFKMESNGYTVILDPYEDDYVPGLAPVRETADAVFCSHEHKDHNARAVVTLKQDQTPSPFTITEIHTWHDEVQGAKRGETAFVFSMTEPTAWLIWEISDASWSRSRLSS